MSSDALGGSDDTSFRTTGTREGLVSVHFVDAHGGGVNPAGETLAFAAITLNLNTELGLLLAEWSIELQVDRVPAELHEGITIFSGVGTRGVRRPVANRLGFGTPDTALFSGDTRGVDVVLSRGRAPVGHTGHGKSGQLVDQSRDDHGLVTGQHSLTEGDGLPGLVLGLHDTSTILTVRLVGEWLLDFAIVVTVQTTVL